LEYISELLKGVVIGVANILPGISGGMLAITMGVYDKIIHAVTQLFKEPLKSFRILFPYGVGAVAGIIFLSLAFEYLFHTYPLQTKMAFLGMIGGGLPSLFQKSYSKDRADRKKGILTAVLTCGAVLLITFIAETIIASGVRGEGMDMEMASGAAYLSSERFWIATMFLVGLVAAATMVVPGVSGSMIMMMLGFYEPILQTNNACIRAVTAFDFQSLLYNGTVLAPYVTGMLIGVFLFARVVERLLTRHRRQMYQVIIGLVFSSPFVILWDMPWGKVKMYELMGGIALALLGYVGAGLLGGEG
jgi:putative membrane protein